MANRGKQSKPQPRYEQNEIQRFVNKEARARFNSEVKERKIHQEKGFLLKNEDHYGQPSEVANNIDARQWTKFASHPHNPIVPLVREFYSKILTVNKSFSMVRGINVSFSASSINRHFGLHDVLDEYGAFLETIFELALNKMLQDLTVEDTTWSKETREGILKCSRLALKPLAKVWYHFIRMHLLSTTHIETVNKERLVLLHCILEGKRVNIGQLIQREISACAFKPKGCLFFSIINN